MSVSFPAIYMNKLKEIIQRSLMPSGAIVWFNLSAAPDGWVVCNGQTYIDSNGVSRTSPNLIDRYPLGATSGIGSNVAAGLPAFDGTFTVGDSINDNHTHSFKAVLWSQARSQEGGSDTDAKWDPGAQSGTTGAATGSHTHNISVTYPTGSIFGSSNTVTPPSVKLLPCIKK